MHLSDCSTETPVPEPESGSSEDQPNTKSTMDRKGLIRKHYQQVQLYQNSYVATGILIHKIKDYVIKGEGDPTPFVNLMATLSREQYNNTVEFMGALPRIARDMPGNMPDSIPSPRETPRELGTGFEAMYTYEILWTSEEYMLRAVDMMEGVRRAFIAMLTPAMYWPDIMYRAELCLYVQLVDIENISEWGRSCEAVSGFLEEFQEQYS